MHRLCLSLRVALAVVLAPVAAWAAGESPPSAPAGNASAPASSPGAGGQPADEGSLLDELQRDLDAQTVPQAERAATRKHYPWVEHHGYFRFRGDWFLRPHLLVGRAGAGAQTVTTSGVLPPLNRNVPNSGDQSTLKGSAKTNDRIAGANIRLRYSPTLHVADWLRVHATVDVLDNVVLGSTPDYALLRPDAPLVVFSGGQAPPSAGRNSLVDSVRVKEAYGEASTIIGLLRVGRMASHWGLGILANGGTHIDSDYGDYVDRIMLVTRLWGVYIAGAYDFVGSGLLAADPNQFFGQPYDATPIDNVHEGVLAFFQRPLTDEDRALRAKRLDVERRPVFDWGVYTVFRRQRYDATSAHQPTYAPEVTGAGGFPKDNTVTPKTFDDFVFLPREAWAVVPDFWARFLWHPSAGDALRIELEAVAIFGEFSAAQDVGETNTARTVRQWGGVLQSEYRHYGLKVGLELGAASGDEAQYLGLRDNINFFELDAQGQTVPNRTITNFKFDQNYYVDLLLFREVIGAVTNAVYAKPTIAYDLFEGSDDSLGGQLDVITAWPLEPSATPGRGDWYGVEFDLSLFYQAAKRFRMDLAWGTLIPGSAFDLVKGFNQADESRAAQFAMTIQGRFFILF